jgi:hypothetical protein
MSGVFPKTEKNSKIKAIVEKALSPFIGLCNQPSNQNNNTLSPYNLPNSLPVSTNTYNYNPLVTQSDKFQAQVCRDFFITLGNSFGHLNDTHYKICFCLTPKCCKALLGDRILEVLSVQQREKMLFQTFKRLLNNKTLQLYEYKILMWTDAQIQCIEESNINSSEKYQIRACIHESPFYIEIDNASIYNDMGNTLFGYPQVIRNIKLLQTLFEKGAYGYIKNMYLLRQIELDIQIIQNNNNSNNTDNTIAVANQQHNRDIIDVNNSSNNNKNQNTNHIELNTQSSHDNNTINNTNSSNNIIHSTNSSVNSHPNDDDNNGCRGDIDNDQVEDYSDIIDDGDIVPEINAMSSMENSIATDDEEVSIGSDNGFSHKKSYFIVSNSKSMKKKDVNNDNNMIGTNPVKKRVLFAATQQSQIYDTEEGEYGIEIDDNDRTSVPNNDSNGNGNANNAESSTNNNPNEKNINLELEDETLVVDDDDANNNCELAGPTIYYLQKEIIKYLEKTIDDDKKTPAQVIRFLETNFCRSYSQNLRETIEQMVYDQTEGREYIVTMNETDPPNLGMKLEEVTCETRDKSKVVYIKILEMFENGFAHLNGKIKVGDIILKAEAHSKYSMKVQSFVNGSIDKCANFLRTKMRPLVLKLRKGSGFSDYIDTSFDVTVPLEITKQLGIHVMETSTYLLVTKILQDGFINMEGAVREGDFLCGVVTNGGGCQILNYNGATNLENLPRPFVLRFRRLKSKPTNDTEEETCRQDDDDDDEENKAMGVLATLAIQQLNESDAITAPANIPAVNAITKNIKTPLVTKIDSRIEIETDDVSNEIRQVEESTTGKNNADNSITANAYTHGTQENDPRNDNLKSNSSNTMIREYDRNNENVHDSYLNEFENDQEEQINDTEPNVLKRGGTQLGEEEEEEECTNENMYQQKQYTQQSQVPYLHDDESVLPIAYDQSDALKNNNMACGAKNNQTVLSDSIEEKEGPANKEARHLSYVHRTGTYNYENRKWYNVEVIKYLKNEELHVVKYSTGEIQKLSIDWCIENRSFYFTDDPNKSGLDSGASQCNSNIQQELHSSKKKIDQSMDTTDRNNNTGVKSVAEIAMNKVTTTKFNDVKCTSNSFAAKFPTEFWETVEETLVVLFEKYYKFTKPLKMNEIVKAISRTLNVEFDETQQARIEKVYNDLVLEKQSLRIKCKFLNKYENDDDEHVYHIVRGAIWYTPSADVKNKRWNEMWEDVTDHKIFLSQKFRKFNKKHQNKKKKSLKKKRERGNGARRSLNNNNSINSEEFTYTEVVFGRGVNKLGLLVDVINIDGKDMLQVSKLLPGGYAAISTDVMVGDVIVHVRTHSSDHNLEVENDAQTSKEYILTPTRPLSLTMRRSKAKKKQRIHDGLLQTPIKNEIGSWGNYETNASGNRRSSRISRRINGQALL